MRVEKRKVCMRVFLTIMSWSDEDEVQMLSLTKTLMHLQCTAQSVHERGT